MKYSSILFLVLLLLPSFFSMAPLSSSKALATVSAISSSASSSPVSTIGTSTSALATQNDYQGQVFTANGLYWFFYFDGSNYGFRTSVDGSSWSSETTLTTSILKGAGDIAYYVSGNSIYYAGGKNSADKHFYYRYGALNSDGTITWTISESAVPTTYPSVKFPSIILDSSGNIWVSLNSYNNANYIEVYKTSTSIWSRSLIFSQSGSAFSQLVPLSSGKVALLYPATTIRIWNGVTWSSPVSTSVGYHFGTSSAVAIGDTVELAATNKTNIYYQSFTYGNSAWSPPIELGSGNSAGISGDGTSNLLIFYTSSNTVSFVNSSDSGSSWSAPTTISSNEANPSSIDASFNIAAPSYSVEAGWTSGSSSPFNLRFASVSLSSSPPPSQVTQPVTLALSELGSPAATFTVSGCNATPSTILGDGIAHNITANANCVVTITAPPASSSSRYVFSGGQTTEAFTTCGSSTCSDKSYSYDYQYAVSFTANSSGGGSVAPSSGWYNASSSVPISATSNSGYNFTDWTSSSTSISIVNNTSNSTSVAINGAGTVTANFASSGYDSPSNVASSTVGGAIGLTDQRKVFQSQGLYWVFYCDGSHIGYVSSKDGSTWSAETTIGASCNIGQRISVWVTGNTIYYVLVKTSSTDKNFYYGDGTLSSTGKISWSVNGASYGTNYDKVDTPSISVDSAGNIWVVVSNYDGTNYHLEVYEQNGSWSLKDKLSVGSTNKAASILFPTSGIAIVYGSSSGTVSVITSSNGGSTWSSPVATSSSAYAYSDSQAVVVGNTIYLATTDRTNVFFLTYNYGATSWSSAFKIGSGRGATLSTDGSSGLILAYHVSSTTIEFATSTNSGLTWKAGQIISTSENGIHDNIGSSYLIANNKASIIWMVGTGASNEIRFATVSLTA